MRPNNRDLNATITQKLILQGLSRNQDRIRDGDPTGGFSLTVRDHFGREGLRLLEASSVGFGNKSWQVSEGLTNQIDDFLGHVFPSQEGYVEKINELSNRLVDDALKQPGLMKLVNRSLGYVISN